MNTFIKEEIHLPEIYNLTADAEDARNEMVLEAKAIGTVTNPAEQQIASTMGSAIQKHVKEVGRMRLELAKPINDAAKLLIQLETDYCAPLLAEKDRLGKLVTYFQQSEAWRVAEEEQKRAAAIAQLETERQQAEEQAKAAQQGMVSEADLALAIKAEADAKAAADVARSAIVAPLPEVFKARGAATKRVLKWEVTDIRALCQARPELCKIEPKASAINAVCVPELPVPGLKLWWEDSTHFISR